MNVLNSNIPSFKGLVRKSYFTKNQSDSETYLNQRNLRKLFGITENEDYDITKDNLNKYLEHHLKKLVTYYTDRKEK